MRRAATAFPAWEDAVLAAALLAIDPSGLGGASVRCGSGPVRDRWESLFRQGLDPAAPIRRAPPHIEDDRLLGGLDLPASLAAGRPVAQAGLLAEADGGVLVIPMAERIDTSVAGRIGCALDEGEVIMERDGLALRLPARFAVVALDEGIEPEERPSRSLLDRLAFHLDLDVVAPAATGQAGIPVEDIAAGRERLADVTPAPDAIVEAICETAARLGIGSVRPALLALRAARAHAALDARTRISAEDAAVAARLVLARRIDAAPQDAAPEAEQPQDQDPPDPVESEAAPPPDAERLTETDLVIEAIRAALPQGLLDQLASNGSGPAAQARGRGAGAKTTARHGRAVGSRNGPYRAGDRVNLVETLRAAAPWQRLRGGRPGVPPIKVLRQDLRLRRLMRPRERTTILVVDASGSTALQRLAEAKGAVELLLARAYVARSRVALIAFRGQGAELLLPPTRSLTRARRRLAELPGGGGTPLAAAIETALLLALAERAMRRDPELVFLTDGKANVGLAGVAGREAAEADALAIAERVRAAGIHAAWLDTSPRPQPGRDRIARSMGAAYAPLPYANAESVADLVGRIAGPPP